MRTHQSHAVTKICSLELSLAKFPARKRLRRSQLVSQGMIPNSKITLPFWLCQSLWKKPFISSLLKLKIWTLILEAVVWLVKLDLSIENRICLLSKMASKQKMSAVTIQWEHRQPVPCFAILIYKLVLSLLGNALLNLHYFSEKHISDLHWCDSKWAKFGGKTQ